MKFISTILSCLGVYTLCLAQGPSWQQPTNCGIESVLTTKQTQAEAAAFQSWQLAKKIGSVPVVRTIPVVFHLIEANPSITDEEVQTALASLNNAFSHSHFYPEGKDYSVAGVGVDTEIQFCLAQRTPDGGVTSGITRITSSYEEFDMELENEELKTHGQWDPRYYLNIWVVNRINSEIFAIYSGRNGWNRGEAGGYATLPAGIISSGHQNDGIVVAGLRPNTLAHEAGHYLGLLHTFGAAGGDGCINYDCTLNGDRVCDTPPDSFVRSAPSCDQPDNSCSTDTLSNYSNGFFPADVPDMITNFMDYGNGPCHYDFTNGQKERMHFHLDTYRIDLFTEAPSSNDACMLPCDADLELTFTRDKLYPLPDETIQFSSTAAGVDTFAWYVEALGGTADDYSVAWVKGYVPTSVAVSDEADLTYTFPDAGKYRVYLKAWHSGDPDCHISYMSIVKVTCGVDARFWPNKRIIASKQPAAKMLDSVFFTNRSEGAHTYQWTVTHYPYDNQTPAQAEWITDAFHLNHTFLEPGEYHITLIASDTIGCQDTLGPFILPVEDPTIDGIPVIPEVACFQEDNIRIVLRMYNWGYDTIRVGTPVSFYDADPRQTAEPVQLLHTYYLNRLVYGRDTYEDFYLTIPLDQPQLDQLYVVFNDPGLSSFPLSWPTPDLNVMSVHSEFPPTGYNELRYLNNINWETDFQFRIQIDPPPAIACVGTELAISASVENGPINQFTWTANAPLSCIECPNPSLSVGENDIQIQLIASTSFSCLDTSTLSISVVDYEDPVLQSPPDVCEGSGSLQLADYASGTNLNWYTTATGGTGSAQPPQVDSNVPGNFTVWVSENANGCESARQALTYTIQSTPPAPPVLAIPERCVGSNSPNLTAFVGGANLLWYTSAVGGVSSTLAPVVSTDQAGDFTYWVSQVQNECESERVPLTFRVYALPPVPSVSDIPDLCEGEAVVDLLDYVVGENLRWYDSVNAGNGTGSTPIVSTSVEKTYSYWVSQRVNNCEGPRALVTLRVLPKPGPPDVLDIPERCAGTTAPELGDFVTGTDLRWYDSSTDSTGVTVIPMASSAVAGTFQHWISQTINGCESERVSLPYLIKDYPPAPQIAPIPDLCLDDPPLDLAHSVSGTDVLWYTNSSTDTGYATAPIVTADNPQTYQFWVTQTIDECESAKETIQLAVIELALETGGPYVLSEGDQLNLEATVFIDPTESAYQIQWLDAAGFVVGDAATILVAPTDSTTYTVVVDAGACVLQEELAVHVRYTLRPAQIFSPNGDGRNDYWQISRIERFPHAEVSVFNRWGALVYHRQGDYLNDWDGSWRNGEPLPIATYYYVIDAYGDGREMVTGSITLMR